MKSEFLKLKNRRSMIVIALIMLVPFIDLFFNIYSDTELGGDLHPAMAAFLSGSSTGHMAQILLMCTLPVYMLMIYSGSVIAEKDQGYLNIAYTTTEKKKYVRQKMSVAFITGFGVLAASLLLNFVLSCIIFSGGTGFAGMQQDPAELSGSLKFSISHPYSIYCLYILSSCFIAGMVNIFCIALGLVLKNNWLLYMVVFLVWILLIINPFSIVYGMQPFTEFGFGYTTVAVSESVILGIAGLILANIYVRRRDAV